MAADLATSPAVRAYAQAIEQARARAAVAGANEGETAPSFADLLATTVEDAIAKGRASEAVSIQAASGGADLQQVVEAVSAAELSLEAVVAVRDRVIAAYQEIMRMPI